MILGMLAGAGFVAMVLAPCAMAIRHKPDESLEQAPVEAIPALAESPVIVPATEAPTTTKTPGVWKKPVPVVRAAATPAPVPVAVKSLREVAEEAQQELRRVQAIAAQAQANLLIETSRTAAKRAQAAEKLAKAAENELLEATMAANRAEIAMARRRIAEEYLAEQDYLPADHPSLDFPRSRSFPGRAA